MQPLLNCYTHLVRFPHPPYCTPAPPVHVRACDAHGNCFTSVTDGVIVDNSAPVGGVVFAGRSSSDALAVLGDPALMQVSWLGFLDPESGIAAREWCVSSGSNLAAPNCDVLAWQKAGHRDSAFATLPQGSQLAAGDQIFVFVRVANHAGLKTIGVSRAVTADTTPPVVSSVAVTMPQFQVRSYASGPLSPAQPAPTALADTGALWVTWAAADPDTPVVRQHIQVVSTTDGHVAGETVRLGHASSATLPRLRLHDGVSYKVLVTACNLGHHCATSASAAVLADGSAPGAGYILGPVGHPGAVSGHLTLRWTGFTDPHSSILGYRLAIGSAPHMDDIVSSRYVGHTGAATAVQSAQLPASVGASVTPYATVVAINTAGLRSGPAAAEIDRNGVMRATDLSPTVCLSCSEVASPPAAAQVTVRIGTTAAAGIPSAGHIVSNASVDAVWYSQGSSAVLAYEYTLALAGQAPGTGFFDIVHEPVWTSAGRETWARIHVPIRPKGSGDGFKAGLSYVVHVRAWLSATTYAVFASPAFIVDLSTPTTSLLQRVIEISATTGDDTDLDALRLPVANAPLTFKARYTDVVADDESDLATIEVAVGTAVGLADVVSWTAAPLLQDLTLSVPAAQLVPGVKLYTLVHATSKAGYHTDVASDGFVVDGSAPLPGSVTFGTAPYLQTYAANGQGTFFVAWRGFEDYESAIVQYEWSLGTAAGADDVISWSEASSASLASVNLSSTVSHLANSAAAVALYANVRCTNAVGLSTVASSQTLLDKAAPEIAPCSAVEGAAAVQPNVRGDGVWAAAAAGSTLAVGTSSGSAVSFAGSVALTLPAAIAAAVETVTLGVQACAGAVFGTDVLVGVQGGVQQQLHFPACPASDADSGLGAAGFRYITVAVPAQTRDTLVFTSSSNVDVQLYNVRVVPCTPGTPPTSGAESALPLMVEEHSAHADCVHVRWTASDAGTGIARTQVMLGECGRGSEVREREIERELGVGSILPSRRRARVLEYHCRDRLACWGNINRRTILCASLRTSFAVYLSVFGCVSSLNLLTLFRLPSATQHPPKALKWAAAKCTALPRHCQMRLQTFAGWSCITAWPCTRLFSRKMLQATSRHCNQPHRLLSGAIVRISRPASCQARCRCLRATQGSWRRTLPLWQAPRL